MSTYQSSNLRKFGSDERGAVAMTFGLMAIALLFFAGMAIDYARALNVRGRIAEAADSAVLAAGRAMLDGQSKAAVELLAKTYFIENTKNVANIATIAEPVVNADRSTGKVTIDIDASVAMTITRIGGFKNLDVPVATEAVFSTRDIEVGMALDITGSMRNPDDNNQSKISGLKSAFAKFANRLLPDDRGTAQKVRIGIAPYSASINLGDYAAGASASKSTDNCVTESKSGSNSDSNSVYYVARDGVMDVDPTEGVPRDRFGRQVSSYVCPSASLTPLSEDRDSLIAAVNSFTPSGWTGGHFGVQWAWNLVSDQWSFDGTKGESYDDVQDGKLLKAVVLMTDGIFNTSYHGRKSSEHAIELCNAMKAKGVVVFSVAFDTSREPADTTTLRACASEGNGYFANASNAEELERAFENFASKLTELRLAK